MDANQERGLDGSKYPLHHLPLSHCSMPIIPRVTSRTPTPKRLDEATPTLLVHTLPSDWADAVVNVGVFMNLSFMMAQCCLCHRTHCAGLCIRRIWVVWRQNCTDWTHDGTSSIGQGVGVVGVLQRWASLGVHGHAAIAWHTWRAGVIVNGFVVLDAGVRDRAAEGAIAVVE